MHCRNRELEKGKCPEVQRERLKNLELANEKGWTKKRQSKLTNKYSQKHRDATKKAALKRHERHREYYLAALKKAIDDNCRLNIACKCLGNFSSYTVFRYLRKNPDDKEMHALHSKLKEKFLPIGVTLLPSGNYCSKRWDVNNKKYISLGTYKTLEEAINALK